MRHLSKFLPYPESSPSLPDASADQEHGTGLHTLVTESFRPLPQGSTGKKDGHLSEGRSPKSVKSKHHKTALSLSEKSSAIFPGSLPPSGASDRLRHCRSQSRPYRVRQYTLKNQYSSVKKAKGAAVLLPGPVRCQKGPGPTETRLFQLWNTNQPPSALPFARTKFMSL